MAYESIKKSLEYEVSDADEKARVNFDAIDEKGRRDRFSKAFDSLEDAATYFDKLPSEVVPPLTFPESEVASTKMSKKLSKRAQVLLVEPTEKPKEESPKENKIRERLISMGDIDLVIDELLSKASERVVRDCVYDCLMENLREGELKPFLSQAIELIVDAPRDIQRAALRESLLEGNVNPILRKAIDELVEKAPKDKIKEEARRWIKNEMFLENSRGDLEHFVNNLKLEYWGFTV